MSLSRKNSSDEIVEHKNPLYRRSGGFSPLQSPKNAPSNSIISDMFSEEEVTNLMQNLQSRAQLHDSHDKETNSIAKSKSAPKSPSSPLTRLSMKIMNRKSMEIDSNFLRVSSSPHQPPSPNPKTYKLERRNSMEMSREPSFRYRANSDATNPHFPPGYTEPISNSTSLSTSALITSNDPSRATRPPSRPSSPASPAKPSSSSTNLDESCCNSIVYVDEKRKVVAAATLEQLIYLLAGDIAPDKDFIAQFLRTHHRFVDSKEFLQRLIDRYNLPAASNVSEEEYIKKKKIVQVRIINVIKKWIEFQLSDFQNDSQLVLMLQRFVNALLDMGGTEAIWASNLQIALLQSEGEQSNPSIVITTDPPKPILPKNMIARLMQFSDLHPQELARQMTLLDSVALCNVENSEYMHKRWSSPDCETLAPNLLKIINQFNKTSYWMASEILRQTEVKHRVKMLSRCIKLTKYLLEMNNMQSLMAVYSALNMGPIQRLQDTWKGLPSKYSLSLKNIGEMMSSSQNYKNYREHLQQINPPFIPLQLVYLSDLTFLEEAPDLLDNGLINFKKMGLIGNKLNEIHQCRTVKHTFTPILPIQEYITLSQCAAMDESQLYTTSKIIEPRKET